MLRYIHDVSGHCWSNIHGKMNNCGFPYKISSAWRATINPMLKTYP